MGLVPPIDEDVNESPLVLLEPDHPAKKVEELHLPAARKSLVGTKGATATRPTASYPSTHIDTMPCPARARRLTSLATIQHTCNRNRNRTASYAPIPQTRTHALKHPNAHTLRLSHSRTHALSRSRTYTHPHPHPHPQHSKMDPPSRCRAKFGNPSSDVCLFNHRRDEEEGRGHLAHKLVK